MSFELLPALGYWVAAVAVVVALGIALVVGLAAGFVTRNRKIRRSRHESIRSFYGHLPLAH